MAELGKELMITSALAMIIGSVIVLYNSKNGNNILGNSTHYSSQSKNDGSISSVFSGITNSLSPIYASPSRSRHSTHKTKTRRSSAFKSMQPSLNAFSNALETIKSASNKTRSSKKPSPASIENALQTIENTEKQFSQLKL
jgi:hypothetical protein